MENQFYGDFDWKRADEESRSVAGEYRTPFQIDRDRIIHTSAFRRLQNKTQVFFSGEYDFYRTRLTHSIEVAQIGRSICQRLRTSSSDLNADFFIDPDLVEAACLSHDIGHPPFGHTGERTLHRLMKPYGGFEGNAQTLRIITQTIYGPERGMNPSRGFVDGVLKYKTLFGEVPEQKNHFLYREQKPWLEQICDGQDFPTELPPGEERNDFRSIECQIMDWADDSAYSLNDIADGVHAGFITIRKVEKWAEENSLSSSEKEELNGLLRAIRRDRIEALVGARIGEFIAGASLKGRTNFLSEKTNRHRFKLHVDQRVQSICKLYKKLAFELVFQSQELQQLDRKSDYILRRLFEVFAELYIVASKPGGNHFRLFSPDEEKRIFLCESEAERARLVCDSLARMTDGVASRTYKRLFDADFGSIMDLV